jgi:hypothetical protein
MHTSAAITFDAAMTASEALARAARNGYWLDSQHPAVRAVLEKKAALVNSTFDEVEEKLNRSPFDVGAAIRRQWYGNIVWYARPLFFVLDGCLRADPETSLLDALDLHEHDGVATIDVDAYAGEPETDSVVLDGGVPVAVSLDNWGAGPPGALEEINLAKPEDGGGGGSARSPDDRWAVDDLLGIGSSDAGAAGSEPEEEAHRMVRAWPRLEAPESVPAGKVFTVLAGLASTRQTGVAGGLVEIRAPAGQEFVDVTIELIADGFDAPSGWSRDVRVPVDNPAAAVVEFELVGRDPSGTESVHLSMLEIRYVYQGAVCGMAARPIIVVEAALSGQPLPGGFGTPWTSEEPRSTAVTLKGDAVPVDLEIEISKPDANPAGQAYVCRLYSRHLSSSAGPFEISLGDDAQSFAKGLVNDMRSFDGTPMVENAIDAYSRILADKLGTEVLAVVRQVAARTAPAAPAVLLVSAEPYVPWELTRFDPPLDPARPPLLGAQVRLGRWLREGRQGASPAPTDGPPEDRPPVRPPAVLPVGPMAVMAGYYNASSGKRQLPMAQAEAQTLAKTYKQMPAIAVEASLAGLKRLLDADLVDTNQQTLGAAGFVHFAGHGEYDPTTPDASVLVLSDGTAVRSFLFRSARYGKENQPLIFINACMVGIGDQLLGDMGGFPGNCLKGGFGGVLGALWEVNDHVARDMALEFWRRAVPTDGSNPEPVGEILRDLRARYAPGSDSRSPASWLAYVFYGHPGLTVRPQTGASTG